MSAQQSEDIEERKKTIEEYTRNLSEKRAEVFKVGIFVNFNKRDNAFNRRKELWKRDNEMDSTLQNYKNELLKSERQLQSSVNKV